MRDAEAAAPLRDAELDHLFLPFATARLLALAVSGGADSLALMVVAARWRAMHAGRPDILVLSVDHRLRRGSGREAAGVVAAAKLLGLKGWVLRRAGTAPKTDVEAAARRARYRLLLDAARGAGATHLLTAHHRDDVAETFLLRLQRGAGLFGLAAMRRSIDLGDILLARPLLDVPRARLAATTKAAGLTPVLDPMNTDPRFARARIRLLMPSLKREGFDPAAIAATAQRLATAADAIDAAVTAFLATAVRVDDFAVAWLNAEAWRTAAAEVRHRALVRLLLAVGGEDYPPRRERLMALADALASHAAGRLKRTLSGTVIEWRDGQFAFCRETGREGLPVMPLQPGKPVVWDGRFTVGVGQWASSGLTVAGSGLANGQAVGRATLPGIWRRGRLLAVPSLGHFTKEASSLAATARPILAERLARPPLFPDFGARNTP
jgi:tRNA(Ile)-lysidine synthase